MCEEACPKGEKPMPADAGCIQVNAPNINVCKARRRCAMSIGPMHLFVASILWCFWDTTTTIYSRCGLYFKKTQKSALQVYQI